MFKKIAVPLDGSALAEKALPFAIGLAHQLNASLLLLRVTHLPVLLTDTPEHELGSLEVAESYLAGVKNTITNPALPNSLEAARVEVVVVYGETAPELIEMAPFEKADLLVMTTHGRTGIGRLLGSVANKVLLQSKLPVLLIKPEMSKTRPFLEETLTGNSYFNRGDNKILVTLDGTPEAEAILEPAIQMAKETEATIHLLQVVMPFTPVDFGGGYYYGTGLNLTDDTEIRTTEATQYLSHIQERLSQQEVQTTTLVKIGNPAEEIVAYAGVVKPGMLALATHARNTVGKFFMGSVADEVLHKSHLPLLLVHTAAPAKVLRETEILEKYSTSKG